MADPVFPPIDVAGEGQLYARLKTTQGTMIVHLEEQRTPKTVANFVGLATGRMTWKEPKTGEEMKGVPMYDGIRFHRVIPQFMVQIGDPLARHVDMKGRWGTGGPGYRFGDEFDATLKHDRPGVLSMANSGPGTNGSQIFITEVPTPHLNGKHSVFGRVVVGVDVIKKLANVPTQRDCPLEDQFLETVEIFRSATLPTA
jgi:peptidyl-prolyl cis-trans isomerase A (cyclophilin A)